MAYEIRFYDRDGRLVQGLPREVCDELSAHCFRVLTGDQRAAMVEGTEVVVILTKRQLRADLRYIASRGGEGWK